MAMWPWLQVNHQLECHIGQLPRTGTVLKGIVRFYQLKALNLS